MWTAILLSRRAAPDRAALEQLNRRVDALDADLRTRIETLERIVTDSRDELKRQFDRLDRGG
jgi:hypothetical protein